MDSVVHLDWKYLHEERNKKKKNVITIAKRKKIIQINSIGATIISRGARSWYPVSHGEAGPSRLEFTDYFTIGSLQRNRRDSAEMKAAIRGNTAVRYSRGETSARRRLFRECFSNLLLLVTSGAKTGRTGPSIAKLDFERRGQPADFIRAAVRHRVTAGCPWENSASLPIRNNKPENG